MRHIHLDMRHVRLHALRRATALDSRRLNLIRGSNGHANLPFPLRSAVLPSTLVSSRTLKLEYLSISDEILYDLSRKIQTLLTFHLQVSACNSISIA